MKLVCLCGLVLLVLDGAARLDQAPRLPLVQADYQRCIMVKGGPLHRQRRASNGFAYRSELS